MGPLVLIGVAYACLIAAILLVLFWGVWNGKDIS